MTGDDGRLTFRRSWRIVRLRHEQRAREHLPPNASVVERLALMSISFNDQWRARRPLPGWTAIPVSSISYVRRILIGPLS
jgi:hypothetical protein